MSSAANSAECIHLHMNKLGAKIQIQIQFFFEFKRKQICAADQSLIDKKRKAMPKLPHRRGFFRLMFAKPVQTMICSILTLFVFFFAFLHCVGV